LIEHGLFEIISQVPSVGRIGALIAVFCCSPNRGMSSAVSLLPRILASEDSECTEFGLLALQCLLKCEPAADSFVLEQLSAIIDNLFRNSDLKLIRLVLETFAAIDVLPGSLIPMLLELLSTVDNPKIFDIGCRIFSRQIESWKGVNDRKICDILLIGLGDRAFGNRRSAVRTLVLYWNDSFPFSSALCSALIELAEVEDILCENYLKHLYQLALVHSTNEVMVEEVMQHIESLRTLTDCEESQIAALAASFAGFFPLD
jgi:hypothetical protein